MRQLPYLKKLPEELEYIKNSKFQASACQSIRLYVMDESRLGLLSIQRRCLTAKGVKPVIPYQHRFGNFYLFGAYAPSDGDHFTLELPCCNTDCFQIWLDEFSVHRPEEFKVIVLDNGAFHKASRLGLPSNICLLFVPPYSPELNPAEMIWRWIKDRLANIAFKSIESLSDAVAAILKSLTADIVKSITGWNLYTNAGL
jgi:transposase